MSILDRYLGRAVLSGALMALMTLLPLLGFFILADEMDQVGESGYRLADVLVLVALSLPRYAYQLFPIATLIGALIGLGLLASGSELVAMRAAGVSIARIVWAASKAGGLLALLAVGIGEGIAPEAEQKALQRRSEVQSGQVTLKTSHGFWARDGHSYINIREIASGTSLRDIFLYEFDDNRRLVLATHAREARYEAGHWVLRDISRNRITEESVEVDSLPRADWESLLDPALLQVVIVEPQLLPVWSLWRYVRFMNASGQEPGAYEVAMWNKIVHPFLILAMIFLAIPILFASARSSGLGRRMFAGVVVGIAFYLVSRTFSYLALLYGLSARLAAVLPPLLFLGGGLWALQRTG